MNNKLNKENLECRSPKRRTRTRKKYTFNDTIKEDCCTEKDMRIIKFETLIDDVQNAFFDENFTTSINEGGELLEVLIEENVNLGLIYDYDKLNDYGKVIVNHSRLNKSIFVNSTLNYTLQYLPYNSSDDFKYKLNAAREFIKLYRVNGNTDEGYKFIFWSMFILAVDKNDAEEKLSLICDFARMLNISDNELRYIFIVLKSIIHKKNYEQKFVKESEFGKVDDNVRKIFSRVLSLCEN